LPVLPVYQLVNFNHERPLTLEKVEGVIKSNSFVGVDSRTEIESFFANMIVKTYFCCARER